MKKVERVNKLKKPLILKKGFKRKRVVRTRKTKTIKDQL
ncbi:MAG: hypothetical protein ACI9QD_000487 [Thermoproteota archaeon]|jgi:hypothetical protein